MIYVAIFCFLAGQMLNSWLEDRWPDFSLYRLVARKKNSPATE